MVFSTVIVWVILSFEMKMLARVLMELCK